MYSSMILIDFLCVFFLSDAKGEYITEAGLYGFNTWYIGADSNNILLNGISSGMGIQQCT